MEIPPTAKYQDRSDTRGGSSIGNAYWSDPLHGGVVVARLYRDSNDELVLENGVLDKYIRLDETTALSEKADSGAIELPEYTTSDAPPDTLFFNSSEGIVYKDASGNIHGSGSGGGGGSGENTVRLSEYTSDSDGDTPVDSAFDSAVSAATPGDTIVFDLDTCPSPRSTPTMSRHSTTTFRGSPRDLTRSRGTGRTLWSSNHEPTAALTHSGP